MNIEPKFFNNAFNIIIASPVTAQARTHAKKKWMGESYHLRINKKWLKRYGTNTVSPIPDGSVITIGNTIYCTAEQANALRKAMDETRKPNT